MGPFSLWNSVADAPSSGHFLMAIYFALGFGVVRFLLDALLFQRLATRVLCNGVNPLKIEDARRTKIAKFTESMWKLTYYGGVESWILGIMYWEPWSRDTYEYFKGWPNQELKIPVKLFYMCQCGFYVYSIDALLTWETRRKDFSIMMSHHIITTILIGYSYTLSLFRHFIPSTEPCKQFEPKQYSDLNIFNLQVFPVLPQLLHTVQLFPEYFIASRMARWNGIKEAVFFRIGSIILALHDACDVFLEAAKIFKYSELEMGASIFFGLFALSWLLLRLIFFPFWVIRTSSYYSIEFLAADNNFITMYYIFNTMLLTLLVFHIYWWILICSMIRRQLKNRGKVGEDIRSDSEDES